MTNAQRVREKVAESKIIKPSISIMLKHETLMRERERERDREREQKIC